jgi:hypothetical protein
MSLPPRTLPPGCAHLARPRPNPTALLLHPCTQRLRSRTRPTPSLLSRCPNTALHFIAQELPRTGCEAKTGPSAHPAVWPDGGATPAARSCTLNPARRRRRNGSCCLQRRVQACEAEGAQPLVRLQQGCVECGRERALWQRLGGQHGYRRAGGQGFSAVVPRPLRRCVGCGRPGALGCRGRVALACVWGALCPGWPGPWRGSQLARNGWGSLGGRLGTKPAPQLQGGPPTKAPSSGPGAPPRRGSGLGGAGIGLWPGARRPGRVGGVFGAAPRSRPLLLDLLCQQLVAHLVQLVVGLIQVGGVLGVQHLGGPGVRGGWGQVRDRAGARGRWCQVAPRASAPSLRPHLASRLSTATPHPPPPPHLVCHRVQELGILQQRVQRVRQRLGAVVVLGWGRREDGGARPRQALDAAPGTAALSGPKTIHTA